MNDQDKTRQQFIEELAQLRQRVAEQEAQLARRQQSEADQRQINDSLPVLVATAGLDGHYKRVNAAFERILGWSEQESLSRPFIEFIHPDDRAAALETFERLNSGETVINFVDRNVCKDGSHRWINWIVIPVLDRGTVFGIGQDITEKKLGEEERQRLEAKWCSVVGNAPVFVALLDDEDKIQFLNRAAPGMSVEDAVGKSAYEFLQPEYVAKARESVARVRRTGKSTFYECVGAGPNGELSWYETHVGPVLVDDEIVAVSLISNDITERKQAEVALRESERRLSTLMSNLPGMAYRCRNDPKWSMEFVSEGAFQLTGYEASDLIENRDVAFGDLIHADDREPVWDQVQKAIAKRRLFRLEYRIRTASGKERWVWEQGVGVFSDTGELQAIEGLITDISERQAAEATLRQSHEKLECRVNERTTELVEANTSLETEIQERREAEELLRQSEAKYRAFVESSPDAVVTTDLKGRLTFASHQAAELHGVGNPQEMVGRTALELVSEEERDRLRKNLNLLMEQGIRKNDEYTALREDGTTVPVEISSAVIRNAGGEPVALMAVCRDITERKQAQDGLQKEQDALRRMLQASWR